MIDLHSHILPELDDGARSLGESLAMARMAVDSGIRVMVATPHCAEDRTREVYLAWKYLRRALQENEIPLRLFLGMEILGQPDTAKLLQERKLFTINGSRYPLIEFPFQGDGKEETWILYSICKAGYRPVVAHPERYVFVQRNPELMNLWHRMGCLLQINRGSLLGRFGGQIRELSWELVDRGFASAIASDSHSARMRTPRLDDVWRQASRDISTLCTRKLMVENPGKIIKNEDIPPVTPEWF
ncbi:MAG: hypothetical protein IJE81_00890 [Oscillospiraceae bacterium]|nr:hypothetical protein [Oscillospiraceae bacterium]